MQFVKFLHISMGITFFFGIVVASFFYIVNSWKQSQATMLCYALRASFYGDLIIFPMVVLQYITAILLVKSNHLSLAVPWIAVAYLAFSLIALLWFMNLIIKYVNYRRIKQHSDRQFVLKSGFYLFNILMIAIFILIIHDAIMQKTYFTLFHLKG